MLLDRLNCKKKLSFKKNGLYPGLLWPGHPAARPPWGVGCTFSLEVHPRCFLGALQGALKDGLQAAPVGENCGGKQEESIGAREAIWG